ncbi:hypothetical protein DIJ64_02385 [Mycobacterium leprae]|uniref:Uncharacterized protein n=1 Tax=Mycobacterium leprae TaxID=1769 RepID=A0AAD0KV65_MYCLR|nr:hypothetical protein [Mycobacterium leprae]AWV47351.1 hypothetical protein DIJ64_02385 [Mycobacterium leprae]
MDDSVAMIKHHEAAILGIGVIKPLLVSVGNVLVVCTISDSDMRVRLANGAQMAQFHLQAKRPDPVV